MASAHLGEFEQQLLLVILRLGRDASATEISRELESCAGRRVSRGALYTTLDRLEDKGLVRSKPSPGGAAREGLPRRTYSVTAAGLTALRATRETLQRLWQGVEHLLREQSS